MNKTKYIIFTIAILFSFNLSVSAGGASLSAPSSATVGSTFSANVNLSGVAAWSVKVSASGPVSGCSLNAADSTADASDTSKSLSVSCKPTGTGNITITLSGDVTSSDGNNTTVSGSKTVTVSNASTKSSNTTTTNTEEKKSNNNSLKSLGVDGYDLNPSFDTNITDYAITMPSDIKKIKITGEATDSKANVEGLGEKDVNSGLNTIEVKVTAEDGSTKTYKINVTIDDNPLTVKIKGKNYNVVKFKNQLPELKIEHEDQTLTIKDTEIPAYRIDKINYVLIGLEDTKGKIKLYRFKSYKNNNKKFTYTPFIYFEYNNSQIVYLDFPKNKIPNKYKKYSIKINDQKIDCYKQDSTSKYALIYGLNIQTGNKNIYKYEQTEKTFQIYDNGEIKKLKNTINELEIIILIFIAISILVVFIKIIQIIKYRKKTKKINIKH